jgi:hypothetical protein
LNLKWTRGECIRAVVQLCRELIDLLLDSGNVSFEQMTPPLPIVCGVAPIASTGVEARAYRTLNRTEMGKLKHSLYD